MIKYLIDSEIDIFPKDFLILSDRLLITSNKRHISFYSCKAGVSGKKCDQSPTASVGSSLEYFKDFKRAQRAKQEERKEQEEPAEQEDLAVQEQPVEQKKRAERKDSFLAMARKSLKEILTNLGS